MVSECFWYHFTTGSLRMVHQHRPSIPHDNGRPTPSSGIAPRRSLSTLAAIGTHVIRSQTDCWQHSSSPFLCRKSNFQYWFTSGIDSFKPHPNLLEITGDSPFVRYDQICMELVYPSIPARRTLDGGCGGAFGGGTFLGGGACRGTCGGLHNDCGGWPSQQL